MRVIILGAGQVGGTLAHNLAQEDNDVTLIDVDDVRLQKLQNRLDIQIVHGNASHPSSLLQAGIQQADMLIAVTNCDEVNMIACFIAYNLFKTPSKIARIRTKDYSEYPKLFANNAIPIDVCISPEELVTSHIINLIKYPGTTQILEFANGKILLITIKINLLDEANGKNIKQITQLLEDFQVKIAAVFRNKSSVELHDNLLLMQKDNLTLVVEASAIKDVLQVLGYQIKPNKRIMIAGGGHIGFQLARDLENFYQVKVIEHNTKSATKLADSLDKATVLDGDIADKNLLLNENIEFTDVFCAVTNDDEANIMASLQAKNLGAKYTMSLVNRDAYVDLIDDSSIDYAISPQLITIGSILTKLRRGNMVKVYRLDMAEVEAIELIIRGGITTSKVIGRRVSEIELPPSCIITAIFRHEVVYTFTDDLILQDKDHVIILLLKRKYIRQVESLFQVNLSFMS